MLSGYCCSVPRNKHEDASHEGMEGSCEEHTREHLLARPMLKLARFCVAWKSYRGWLRRFLAFLCVGTAMVFWELQNYEARAQEANSVTAAAA